MIERRAVLKSIPVSVAILAGIPFIAGRFSQQVRQERELIRKQSARHVFRLADEEQLRPTLDFDSVEYLSNDSGLTVTGEVVNTSDSTDQEAGVAFRISTSNRGTEEQDSQFFWTNAGHVAARESVSFAKTIGDKSIKPDEIDMEIAHWTL